MPGNSTCRFKTRADRRAAEGQLPQDRDRPLRPFARIGNLPGVAAEFLAEPDRGRIHQMGPADLDDPPEFVRLDVERAVQLFQRRNQTVLELFRRADVNRRWNHVVARLPHVDVIVRMNRITRADRFSRQLAATIRDHFVRVRVRARAGTGLENVEREMLVQFALHDFLRRLHDERAPMGIEQTEIGIRLRGGPFDQAQSANERPRKSIAADRKIQDRPLGGSAVERGFRDGHFAHRILFGPGRPGRHAE